MLSATVVLAVDIFPTKPKSAAMEYWIRKRYGKQQHDVLLLGDSRSFQGIDPRILQKYIPSMNAYCFGFSAGSINLQLLKEYVPKRLKRNGKRILVFNCTSLDLIGINNQCLLSIDNGIAPPLLTRIFERNLIPDAVYHIDTGYVGTKSLKSKNASSATFGFYHRMFSNRPFLPSDFKSFVQNLKWCKRNNIKVVAYRMVSCREMDELEDKLSGVDWNKIKQAVLDEGFVWLERPPSPLLEQIEEHCWDASHLNAEGAELFSNWLGQELAKLDWFKEDQQTSETEK